MRYAYVPAKYENLSDYTHWNLSMTNRERWIASRMARWIRVTRERALPPQIKINLRRAYIHAAVRKFITRSRSPCLDRFAWMTGKRARRVIFT